MSQQIRLRRAQDKRFQRTNEPAQADVIPIRQTAEELRPAPSDQLDARSMCYFCQKCKNHEILVWKKVRVLWIVLCSFLACSNTSGSVRSRTAPATSAS